MIRGSACPLSVATAPLDRRCPYLSISAVLLVADKEIQLISKINAQRIVESYIGYGIPQDAVNNYLLW